MDRTFQSFFVTFPFLSLQFCLSKKNQINIKKNHEKLFAELGIEPLCISVFSLFFSLFAYSRLPSSLLNYK